MVTAKTSKRLQMLKHNY